MWLVKSRLRFPQWGWAVRRGWGWRVCGSVWLGYFREFWLPTFFFFSSCCSPLPHHPHLQRKIHPPALSLHHSYASLCFRMYLKQNSFWRCGGFYFAMVVPRDQLPAGNPSFYQNWRLVCKDAEQIGSLFINNVAPWWPLTQKNPTFTTVSSREINQLQSFWSNFFKYVCNLVRSFSLISVKKV